MISAKKTKIASVDKALSILNLFKNNEELSLTEISKKLNFPKTTCFGFIATLEAQEYLRQDDVSGKYSLGYSIVELFNAFDKKLNIRQEALVWLKDLADKYQKNAHLTILDGIDVVYLDSVTYYGELMVKTVVGSRAPSNCTSTGKAFLASMTDEELDQILSKYPLRGLTEYSKTEINVLMEELRNIRKVGYSIDNQESLLGVKGVGVIVKNNLGKPLLGISVSGLATYLTDDIIKECVSDLNKVSDELTKLVGNRSSI